MIGHKKKRRMQLIVVGLTLLAAAAVLIGFGFRQGIQFYRSPSEIAASPPSGDELFRVGGLVEVDSLVKGEGETVHFTITDTAETIDVSYTGILPDLFGEGQGVVALGYLRENEFVASEILAKHDEEYMPKEVIDSLKAQGTYVAPSEN